MLKSMNRYRNCKKQMNMDKEVINNTLEKINNT